MANLLLKLEKQLLTIQNREVIASGADNVDLCQFEFDEYWNGYIKTAVFYQIKDKTYYALLDSNNKCMVPSEVIAKPGRLHIGIFGLKDGNVATSTVENIEILECYIRREHKHRTIR